MTISANCCRFGGDVHLGLGAAGHDFTQVDRPALRGDRPQHIGQVFHPKAIGRDKALKLGVDERLPLAGDVRLALTLGQKAGAGKADLGGATAVPVVDGRDVLAHNLNAVERHIIARLCGLDGLLLLRGWARLLRAQDTRGRNQQS